MKTTIDIADSLLERAKRLAERRNTTLKRIIEDTLREALRDAGRAPTKVRLSTHTFRGPGAAGRPCLGRFERAA